MSYLLRLGLVGLAMTGFLTFMLVSHAHKRAHGTEVIVAVEGYDPRDILLGHYSLLRISMAELNGNEIPGGQEVDVGDLIYVHIAPDADGVWTAQHISTERQSDGVFLRGLVTSAYASDYEWVEVTNPETGEVELEYVESDVRHIRVDYRLNRYYASREMALALDEILRDESQTPRLILSVQRDGTAIIKGLEIAGERRLERLW
ncbi:MAG: GDYXXLXY domain-containing protein [Alphaproteobacteria bacterium]|nr:GDYXXLXY domain-containing protein [Alphaproteobacteria bacterium]